MLVAATRPDGPATALPDPDAIRDAAQRVLSRPGYDLGRGAELPAVGWVREFFDWLVAPFRLLFDAMDGVSDGYRWLIIALLLIVLVALVAHIVYTLATAFRTPRIAGLRLGSDDEPPIDPVDLEAEAARRFAAGDCVGACRSLLHAALAWLQSIRQRRFRPGLTNAELLREYAATPIAGPLRQLVGTIDLKWYGDEPCHPEDYEACRASAAVIRQAVQERRDAVGS